MGIDMYVFGITGGVGAGKSTVLRLLCENFNAVAVQADEVGRMLMEPGQTAYNRIVEVFGDGVLENEVSKHGTLTAKRPDNPISSENRDNPPLNREKLASLIFADNNKRIVLNGIVHPLVKKFITEEIGRVTCGGRYDFMFVEAALLIEDHYDVICDELWYIYANEAVRRQRLAQSRGYSEEKINNIFKSQLRDDEFRKHCSIVIDNSGGEEDTLRQLKEIIAKYG